MRRIDRRDKTLPYLCQQLELLGGVPQQQRAAHAQQLQVRDVRGPHIVPRSA